jgi:hypothetical protein
MKKKIMRSFVASALSVALVLAVQGDTFAASPDAGYVASGYESSDEVSKYTEELISAGLLLPDVYNRPFYEGVTRAELAKYAVAFYSFLGGPDPGDAGDSYLDTADPDAKKAYALGFFDYDDGYFNPSGRVSGSDAIKVLAKAVIAATPSGAYVLPTADAALASLSPKYADADSVYIEDISYVGFMDSCGALLLSREALSGAAAYLGANDTQSREEFFLLLSDSVWAFARARVAPYAAAPAPPKASEYQSYIAHAFKNDVNLYWSESPGAYSYDVGVYISKRLEGKINVGYASLNLNRMSVPTYESVFGDLDKKKACYLKVRAADRHGIKSSETLKVNFYAERFVNINQKLFGNKSRFGFKNTKAAKKYQKTIRVKVWKLSGGKKVKSSMWLTVNKEVADEVKLIFNEIYKGKEKFPVKVMGGFQIRESKRSEHNYGSAIDINPTENCMKDGNTVVSGEFWRPGKNKYSIKPDGDVVKAFEKYGWYWGGHGWGDRKDYMHFSYLGT